MPMLSEIVRHTDGLLPAWGQALTHEAGSLLVLGAPGAGKTALIAARFARFVAAGIPPHRLLVVTPTPHQALALRAELEAELSSGYETFHCSTPLGVARLILESALETAAGPDELTLSTVARGDRVAMLVERIDELPLTHHDIGGSPAALAGGFVRRIDRLKAEGISAEAYARWAQSLPAERRDREAEREFAAIYGIHERMLGRARDHGALVLDARSLVDRRPELAERFAAVLLDDAHELDRAPLELLLALAGPRLTATADPAQTLRRLRGAGTVTVARLADAAAEIVVLERSARCPERVLTAARAVLPGEAPVAARPGGEVDFWRCTAERGEAQAVAADVERLIGREGVSPEDVLVIVPSLATAGQAVAVALEERAVPHRVLGEAAFFQRAEIRDLLAWLRLLADPADAAAVVRALARPPIELRAVDIARCTQIARRRKLDMVTALAAATESPQVPPEARERIRMFLKLYRSAAAAVDTTRPDLYVHRLIDRLAIRRQQLFAAHADVVERLRALAQFGELAAAYVRRQPQATAREFARQVAAVADYGLRDPEAEEPTGPPAARVVTLRGAGGLEAGHVYVLGLDAGLRVPAPEHVPDALLAEALPGDDEAGRARMLAQALYVACTRAHERLVLSHAGPAPAGPVEAARRALGAVWEERAEELFGPGEALHSTYRLLRDELLEGTARAAGRLAELRLDTDLDVTHAVVRYLELLKVAALVARPEGQGVAEALRDVNARILQAATAEQREVFTSSPLDEMLLDTERDARRRAQSLAARDEPSLAPFLPRRGEGVMLSASDIDTYRTCPLKYKFARVFRIPQEPTIHQRFGILVHQVLERYHGTDGTPDGLPQLLGLLDAGWRRGGFGDSEEERQLRGKAVTALTRYSERFAAEGAEPMWFERQFSFKLGPHVLRGRVDRVDRLPSGEYELIDYKTGRPKTAAQLAEDVQLSLYAIGAREAWELEASRQAYLYLLDDEKVSLPPDGEREEWITAVALEVAEGILAQGFEPTPSYAACSVCDYRLVCPAAER